MTEYRRVISDGDLVVQRKAVLGWLCRKTEWKPFRNVSREVRFLEQRMHDAHAVYMTCKDEFEVAQKNVQLDMDVLRMHKMDNTEIAYVMPSDESIFDRREGVKYGRGNSGQKQKGQGGNGNGQQSGGGGGDNQNQQNNKQKGQQRKPMTMLELLTNAKIVLH